MERLVLKGGVHTLDIYHRELRNDKHEFILRCTDDLTCTQDIDGEWVQEAESGCYFLTLKDIDVLIEKLTEVKSLLNKTT
jgi:hypothetical protein